MGTIPHHALVPYFAGRFSPLGKDTAAPWFRTGPGQRRQELRRRLNQYNWILDEGDGFLPPLLAAVLEVAGYIYPGSAAWASQQHHRVRFFGGGKMEPEDLIGMVLSWGPEQHLILPNREIEPSYMRGMMGTWAQSGWQKRGQIHRVLPFSGPGSNEAIPLPGGEFGVWPLLQWTLRDAWGEVSTTPRMTIKPIEKHTFRRRLSQGVGHLEDLNRALELVQGHPCGAQSGLDFP